MKNFGIVEEKIKETDFFLEQLTNSKNLSDARYYLSAFLSASRSITFVLQASISEINGFQKWYEEQQVKLKQNDLAKYFVEARNLSQHVGYYPITSCVFNDNTVKYTFTYHSEAVDSLFQKVFYDNLAHSINLDHIHNEVKNPIPKEDVATACKKYFVLLLEIIQDCYQQFGHIIDPVQYFVYGISKVGKSLEDIEEELDYPRGWTKIESIPEEERIQMLRREFEKAVTIDYVFEKYLGTNRLGEKI